MRFIWLCSNQLWQQPVSDLVDETTHPWTGRQNEQNMRKKQKVTLMLLLKKQKQKYNTAIVTAGLKSQWKTIAIFVNMNQQQVFLKHIIYYSFLLLFNFFHAWCPQLKTVSTFLYPEKKKKILKLKDKSCFFFKQFTGLTHWINHYLLWSW